MVRPVTSGSRMRMTEYQLVSYQGSVLVSFIVPEDQEFRYVPAFPVREPCAARCHTDGGPWEFLAYYPQGYPGPASDSWPEHVFVARHE